MGISLETFGPRFRESRIPIWMATVLILVGLALLAGWLSVAAHTAHETIYEESLKEARDLEQDWKLTPAIATFRQALELNPRSFEARLGLARTLVKVNRFQEAQQQLAQLRLRDPVSGPVHLLAARAALGAGDTERAGEYYQRAVYGFWPADRAAERMTARIEWVRFLSKAPDKSALLGELLRLQNDLPADSPIRDEVARLFLETGQPAEAATAYRWIVARDAKNFTAWLGLGEAELARGDLVEARRAFARASALRIGSAEARDRYNLITAALTLDPVVRRISRAERERRALRLLELTAERLNLCTASLAASSQARAAELLKLQRPPSVEDRIELAEKMWNVVEKLCPPSSEGSSPLSLVFDSLRRMPE